MANYRLSRLAAQDLDAITNYTLERYGIAQARRYSASLTQSFKTISYFPVIGTRYVTGGGRDFRKFTVGRHAIFFSTPEGADVLIVRILHIAMDFDRHLDA